MGMGEGGAGGVTAGCCLYAVTLARIPALSPVTVVGIMVSWGWEGVGWDAMQWDGTGRVEWDGVHGMGWDRMGGDGMAQGGMHEMMG